MITVKSNEVPTELTIWMALRRGSGVQQCNIVTRLPLATIALLCKQTINNIQTRCPPELPMASSNG